LTPEQIDEIEKRAEAATPGHWTAFKTGILACARWVVGNVDFPFVQGMHDAEFIASARTGVPALIADLRAARELLAVLKRDERLSDHADGMIDAFLRGGAQ
jgi:hypothetical protein